MRNFDAGNVPVVKDEDFEDYVDSMYLQDLRSIPEVVRLPGLRPELAKKLGLKGDEPFVVMGWPTEYWLYNRELGGECLSPDEFYAIPRIIREASFVVADKSGCGFRVVFDDMEGDKKFVNNIIFNKSSSGCYQIRVGKYDRQKAFSSERDVVVGFGDVPTVQSLCGERAGSDARSVSESKAGYYSVMADKEPDELVKVRYEEKAAYWRKVADGKPVSAEEEERCSPGHKKDAVDHVIYWRHRLEKSASPSDAAECQRAVNYWHKAAIQEQQVKELARRTDVLVKALAERDEKLASAIDSGDWCD